MKLNCVDFLDISRYLSDEEIMVQRMAKEFAENEVVPIIEDCFENSEFPEQLISKFSDLGFLGVNLPEK